MNSMEEKKSVMEEQMKNLELQMKEQKNFMEGEIKYMKIQI